MGDLQLSFSNAAARRVGVCADETKQSALAEVASERLSWEEERAQLQVGGQGPRTCF